jgi:hypothetical protein
VDLINVTGDVRYRGQSAKHLLTVSISAFDPKRKSAAYLNQFVGRQQK